MEIYLSHQNPRGSPGWLGQSRVRTQLLSDTLLFLALTLTLRSKTLVSVFQAVDPVIGKRMKGQKSSTCVFAGSFQELLHPRPVPHWLGISVMVILNFKGDAAFILEGHVLG